MTREEATWYIYDIITDSVYCITPEEKEACDMAIKVLEEPERVHARWIPTQNPNWKAYSHDQCSVCGWWNTKNAQCYYGKPKKGHSLRYCPNCGAIMDKEE